MPVSLYSSQSEASILVSMCEMWKKCWRRSEKCWRRSEKCWSRSRTNQKPPFRRWCFLGSSMTVKVWKWQKISRLTPSGMSTIEVCAGLSRWSLKRIKVLAALSYRCIGHLKEMKCKVWDHGGTVRSGDTGKCMGDIWGYLRMFKKCVAGRYVTLVPLGHTSLLVKFFATGPRKFAETKKGNKAQWEVWT